MTESSGPAAQAVVGVGASAGGVEALASLVAHLPADLPAAVFVVLHVSPAGGSALAQILNRAGRLEAVAAADGLVPLAGRIYVAPPDRHLLLVDGCIQLSSGPRENGHRPAADPTFRSLAAHHGPRAIGVILSGTRDDGTEGLARIKAAGGVALVQTPEEAAYDGMIRSAMENVAVDAVLPVAEIAAHLAHLAQRAHDMTPDDAESAGERPGKTDTRYTCPECGGHISREENGSLLRFSCEVGHAYSPAALDGEQALAVEGALWTATRLLGDRATLMEEMAVRATRNGHTRSATGFQLQAEEARAAGDAVRSLLVNGGVPTGGGPGVA